MDNGATSFQPEEVYAYMDHFFATRSILASYTCAWRGSVVDGTRKIDDLFNGKIEPALFSHNSTTPEPDHLRHAKPGDHASRRPSHNRSCGRSPFAGRVDVDLVLRRRGLRGSG